MAKKVIPKLLLDKALDMERTYWEPENHEARAEDVFAWHKRIEQECGVYWSALSSLCSAIFPQRGLKHDATNEDIYAILRLLGWEVSD